MSVPSFVSLTPDQAADDHVKIKITKYKAGSSPGGEVKVQEMGEADPQWKHIKDVVKEQLEKAGLKAEGTQVTHCLFSLPSLLTSSIVFCASPSHFCQSNNSTPSSLLKLAHQNEYCFIQTTEHCPPLKNKLLPSFPAKEQT